MKLHCLSETVRAEPSDLSPLSPEQFCNRPWGGGGGPWAQSPSPAALGPSSTGFKPQPLSGFVKFLRILCVKIPVGLGTW